MKEFFVREGISSNHITQQIFPNRSKTPHGPEGARGRQRKRTSSTEAASQRRHISTEVGKKFEPLFSSSIKGYIEAVSRGLMHGLKEKGLETMSST